MSALTQNTLIQRHNARYQAVLIFPDGCNKRIGGKCAGQVSFVDNNLFPVKASAQGIVHAVHRAVDIVHRTDDIHILWDVELFIWIGMQIGILCGNLTCSTAITGVNCEE